MGTIAEVQVAHRDPRLAEDAIDAALGELTWVERTMTRFRPDSDIGRVNLGAARDGVLVIGGDRAGHRGGASVGVGERRQLRPGPRLRLGALGRAAPS